MKTFSILLAMMFLAFSIEAQTVEKTKRDKEKKSTTTLVRKSRGNSSSTKEVKTPTSSTSNGSRSTVLSNKPTSERNTKISSGSPATRNSEPRNSKSVSPQTSTDNSSRTNGNDGNRSSSTHRVNTASSNNSDRNNGNVRVGDQQNQKTQSGRGQVYAPKTSERDADSRKIYKTHKPNRVFRTAPSIQYTYQTLDYRRVHNPYTIPNVIDIYWNVNMYRNYRLWYPDFDLWYYPYGYRIHTVSAYDSYNYIGEVARIYGQVAEVWYSGESNEYYLYIGAPYPYQDFTIILNAWDAKRFSRYPERYFTNRYLTVTGLISMFENKPEILIRQRSQISMY